MALVINTPLEETSYKIQFMKKIIKYSVSDNYKDAIKEWRVENVFTEDYYCICGHEIKENSVVKNINNDTRLRIGCVCIKKFFSQEQIEMMNKLRRNTEECLNCDKRIIKNDIHLCETCENNTNKCTTCGKFFKVNINEKPWKLQCFACYTGKTKIVEKFVNTKRTTKDCRTYNCKKRLPIDDWRTYCLKCYLKNHI